MKFLLINSMRALVFVMDKLIAYSKSTYPEVHKVEEAPAKELAGAEVVLTDDERAQLEVKLKEFNKKYSPEPFIPKFQDANGNQVPMSFDEVPTPEVFLLMYERRYGSGLCPLVIDGKQRMFDCLTLYELLVQIKTNPAPTDMHKALYGTICSLVLHAHGETPAPIQNLN